MTIRELTQKVASTGMLEVTQEAIIEYQDLIGHASEEENRNLLNGEMAESYMRIYGAAYGTVAAIKFYLGRADKVTEIIRERDASLIELEDSKKYTKACEGVIEAQNKEIDRLKKVNREFERDMDGTLKTLEERKAEVVNLKAKLYDLMEQAK